MHDQHLLIDHGARHSLRDRSRCWRASAQSPIAAESTVAVKAPIDAASASQRPDLRGTKALPLVIETIESTEDARQKARAAATSERDSNSTWWAMIIAGCMLAVAAVQAWLFVVQLKFMRRSMAVAESAASTAERSVEVMKDTAQRQLRAYIAVERAWIESPQPGVPRAMVVIKNSGQTPAHEMRHWIHQWGAGYPLAIDLPQPPEDLIMSTTFLGSGASSEMSIQHPFPIVPPCRLDELGTSEATIYIYGEVTYKDVFGTPQFLRYRLMYGGSQPSMPGALKPCEKGNEAS